MIDGQRVMSSFLVNYFRKKLDAICDRVESRAQRHGLKGAKDFNPADGIDFGANELAWKSAIEEVLGHAANVELVGAYTPIVQSVAAKSYGRTSILLGGIDDPAAAQKILARAQQMATQVVGINETTRNRLVETIEQARADGLTIAQTVRQVRDAIPEISAGRIPTIVRTEVGRAIDQGTKQAITDSPSVTYVSVVGCQAIEPNIPTFDGVPTCNIKNVPADRIDELEFHINHTGCIIPTGYTTDGDQDREVEQGTGDGKP